MTHNPFAQTMALYLVAGRAMVKAAFDAHVLSAAAASSVASSVASSKNESDVALFDAAIERFESVAGPCRAATLARIKKMSQKPVSGT